MVLEEMKNEETDGWRLGHISYLF